MEEVDPLRELWTQAGWPATMPLPTQGSLLWAAWHTGDYRRAKRRWYKALLNQDHVNVDATTGVMMNVLWDDGTDRDNWVPLGRLPSGCL